jgi:hypothetical protein
LATAAGIHASGPLGIYGVVERVVFEPNDRVPERVQVWGAFAYVERGAAARNPATAAAAARGEGGHSPIVRGYLYFRLPTFGESVDTVRREWRDLASVAGTGDAVAFGTWGYIGRFEGLRPDALGGGPPYVLERRPAGGERTDLRVRPASERPSDPAAYQTNAGVVRLRAEGSHAALVTQLRDAMK